MTVLPNIPDNFFKFLIVIGIALIVFSYYSVEKNEKNFFAYSEKIFELQDSIDLKYLELRRRKENLLNFNDYVHQSEGITNLFVGDSILYLNRDAFSKIKNSKIKDSAESLRNKYNEYINSDIANSIFIYNKRQTDLNDKFEELKIIYNRNNLILFLSYGILFFGIIGFYKQNQFQSLKIKIEALDILKKQSCQSCGRKFNSILRNSKEISENNSEFFCIECYNLGKFEESNLTLGGLVTRTKTSQQFRKSNFFKKKLIIHKLKKLDRWNKDTY